MSDPAPCPACGTPQTQTGWGEDLCPSCLLRLALNPLTDAGEPAEAETDLFTGRHEGPLSPGKVLGNRYSVRKLLGRGGMGEVWRAFDLKLRVEVALKAMRQDLFKDEKRLEMLRSEVRAAREVVSPNVCRIFDLIEVDGTELVSMEHVDGQTLLAVLQERGPLELTEAQDIASQFLAGLEAIHKAGLVHRDVKPENIMVTRAGRVVVMDFGLARQEASGAGTVAGTPAYMAPEQAAGLEVDARADVYAAGVVLAEMVSPEGIKSLEGRQSVWEGVRSEPVKLPDTPWAPVLKKAVAKERDNRYNSAHTLTRALEDVTLRVEGAEDLHPYPGLASFTEEDAEYFFGREAEVEQMWRRIQNAHLLAIVGPSGAGKTSFIAAGLVPGAPSGWQIVRCTPGGAAMPSLATVVAREMAGDADAVSLLPRFDDAGVAVQVFSKWRRGGGEALLVVDQFEELFTQNSPDAQVRFAELLGRLVLEANVRVLLSMRDDFLMQCKLYEPLQPVFESLVPLMPPAGANLRRALVQPATKCGYRFEDDELVDEMLAEVEGERGALPLLAFAAARLWEKRDRDDGLLTRQAYHDIGGVAGALARHAEETIDRIGAQRVPIVRELFRNLVTAEGTRAVREWDELLSVFDESQRQPAEEVLRELIDARLLTSYEVREEDGDPTRRVEIIHESLLANWPRLVRWQTQDADAVQLRDQLRQAAKTWDEHDRSDDLLWTGSAYREFAVWRDRYPGGLTEIEEAFATAMTAFATRRRRLRRLAAAVVLLISVSVGAVTTILWRRGVRETRRAEASKLLALAQTQLEGDATAALALTRASLELADTPGARRFAVEVLWSEPVARILPVARMAGKAGFESEGASRYKFSLDGGWLATLGGRQVLFFPRNGGMPRALPRQPDGNARLLEFGPRGDLLITGGAGESLRFWSWPGIDEIRSVELGGVRSSGFVRGAKLFTNTRTNTSGSETLWRVWPLPAGAPRVLADDLIPRQRFDVDENGTVVALGRDRAVVVSPLEASGGVTERVIGEAGDVVQGVAFSPGADRVASLDRSGAIRIWSTTGDRGGPLQIFQGPPTEGFLTRFDPTGRYVTHWCPDGSILLWPLEGPPDTEPRVVRRRVPGKGTSVAFDPRGYWAVTDLEEQTVEFWPLETPWVRTFRDVSSTIWSMAFTGDNRWLAVCPVGQPVQLWALDAAHASPRELGPTESCIALAIHPSREEILVGNTHGDVLLYPISGGPPQRLAGGFGEGYWAVPVAFDPEGRRVVAGRVPMTGDVNPANNVLRIWDLDSGQENVYSVAHLTDPGWTSNGLGFAHDGTLYASLGNDRDMVHVTLPDVPGEQISSETVVSAPSSVPNLSGDGRFLMVHSSQTAGDWFEFEELQLFDLVKGTSRWITTHGRRLTWSTQIDTKGRILVTGDLDGVVRAGPLTGEEPHLLLGHERPIVSLAVSPDGHWIASADDASVRLWPMPDVTQPPLHTLPHDKLMAELDSLTNLRAVRDGTSSTGWTLEVGPFPGWEEVPTW